MKLFHKLHRIHHLKDDVRYLTEMVRTLSKDINVLKGVNTKQTNRITRLEQEVMHLMEHKNPGSKAKK